MGDWFSDNKQALFELDTKRLCNGCCHQSENTANHVGGYCLGQSSIQPKDLTCGIFYSSGSFRFRPASKTGNF